MPRCCIRCPIRSRSNWCASRTIFPAWARGCGHVGAGVEGSGAFRHFRICLADSGRIGEPDGRVAAGAIPFLNVAPNYLALLGVKPELGRWFDPQDQTPGFTLDVVISDGLWKRAFGGDPHILGRSLRLDNDVYRVIGVMPPVSRSGANRGAEEHELWAASGFAGPPAPPPLRSSRFLPEAIARLKPGLTIAAAQSRLDALVHLCRNNFRRIIRPKAPGGAAGAAEGERGRQCSPVADAAAGRGGIGAADRLRECRESPAGARQRERTRDGRSPGAGSGTESGWCGSC
jgi:hypothetical protein